MVVLEVQSTSGQAQTPRNLGVSICGRQVERVGARVVGHVHDAAKGAQGLGQTQKTLPGGYVYRGVPGDLVGQVEVGPSVKQQHRNVGVVPADGHVERCVASGCVGQVKVGLGVDQSSDTLQVAPRRRNVKGRITVLIFQVAICPSFGQDSNNV